VALDHYFSKSFEKGIRILNLFNPDRTSLNLKEISQELALNMTSSFRYVNTLIRLNYLKREPKTKALKLGIAALSMGYRLTRSFDPLQAIKPMLDAAHETHNISIDSVLFEKDSVIRLYQREVKGALIFRLPAVERALHCMSMGKAILAFLPEKEMLDLVESMPLIAKTKHSITDKAILMAELKRTRERGYSLNSEEYVLGVISMGAPLLNPDAQRPFGAICFDFLTIQDSLEQVEREYAKTIVKLAHDISEVIVLD
jgi:DNA-binding IclR family transcriptional regulator